jgi:hypothetical protein
VRTKLATVVLSVAAHGTALAWIAHVDEEARPHLAAPPRVEQPTVAPAEVAPMEVAFVELNDAHEAPSEVVVTTTATRPRISTSTRSRTRELAGPAQPEVPAQPEQPEVPQKPAPPTGTFKMRTGPELETLSTRLAQELSDKGEMPVHVPDLPGARIDYEVYKIEAKLRDPRWLARADGEEINGLRGLRRALLDERKTIELAPQKDGTYESDKDVFVAHVGRDGKVTFEDRPNVRVEGLGGRFDTTDWLMRKMEMDPYSSKKLSYMDRTRAQRVEIAKMYRREQLAAAAAYMQQNLERVWATIPDAAGRKQAVFELWDDCAETGDENELTATEEARQRLLSWVHVKLRGADAFTADELARFNARRTSKAVFAP